MSLYEIFWYFVIYAFLGWCLEVCFCTIDTGKLVNRGFLNGPMCPIYGFGMLAVLAALLPLQDNLVLLFIGAIIVTSLIELVGGFALKKIFHTSWWDYSDQPFNLGGYVCLKFSLAWGLAGVAAVRAIHPLVALVVGVVPHLVGIILLLIVVALCLCDFIVTVMAITKMNRDLGIITDIATGLRTGSDALSKNLGETSLAADEKFAAAKQDMSERLTAVKEETGERLSQLLNGDAMDKLLPDNGKHPRWERAKARMNGRLLRAFPHMKHSTHNEALAALRTRQENAAAAHKRALAEKHSAKKHSSAAPSAQPQSAQPQSAEKPQK